jgi:hypothetical protein
MGTYTKMVKFADTLEEFEKNLFMDEVKELMDQVKDDSKA